MVSRYPAHSQGELASYIINNGCSYPGYFAALIVMAPVGVVAPLGSEVTFSCLTRSRVFWIINGLQVTVHFIQGALNASYIFAPLPS